MRAVGRLGQAADVLAHGVAPDPEPPGDLPQGEALDPTKVLTWRPYSPARLISSSGRIRPSPFSRAVAVVRASSRKSATSCWVSPRTHPAPSPICSRKGYAQSFRRPSGRFAAAIANTSGWGRPRTAGRPQGEAAPSIRGADPVLAGTTLRTHGSKRRATVFHRHALDVPRRSLRPALQAVDFCSVRRGGHGQLLHWLASIQLWPARLRRSRMLCRSIVALKAQVARPGGDIPRRSRVPFPCGVGTTRPSWFMRSRFLNSFPQDAWSYGLICPSISWVDLIHRKPTQPPLVLRRGFPEANSCMPRIRSWRWPLRSRTCG